MDELSFPEFPMFPENGNPGSPNSFPFPDFPMGNGKTGSGRDLGTGVRNER